MSITFEIDLKPFEQSLTKYAEQKRNELSKDCKAIAELIKEDIQGNIFNARKIPTGKLKPNTKATANKKGFNAPMIETGELHDSISVRPIQDGYEVFINGEENRLKAFYNHYDRYAKQVFGKYVGFDIKKRNTTGSLKIPARPVFGIRNTIKRELKKLLYSK